MAWFKVDDDFFGHPKVVAAGNSAVGLFIRCGSWSSKHLTEGQIPFVIARSFGTQNQIDALLRVGLWNQKDDGYLIPDFLEYNPSRQQVLAEREAAAERKRKARERAMSRR